MKMKMEVLSVETNGDQLRIQLQAIRERGADWRPCSTSEIKIPDIAAARRKYHVGRIVTLEVR